MQPIEFTISEDVQIVSKGDLNFSGNNVFVNGVRRSIDDFRVTNHRIHSGTHGAKVPKELWESIKAFYDTAEARRQEVQNSLDLTNSRLEQLQISTQQHPYEINTLREQNGRLEDQLCRCNAEKETAQSHLRDKNELLATTLLAKNFAQERLAQLQQQAIDKEIAHEQLQVRYEEAITQYHQVQERLVILEQKKNQWEQKEGHLTNVHQEQFTNIESLQKQFEDTASALEEIKIASNQQIKYLTGKLEKKKGKIASLKDRLLVPVEKFTSFQMNAFPSNGLLDQFTQLLETTLNENNRLKEEVVLLKMQAVTCQPQTL